MQRSRHAKVAPPKPKGLAPRSRLFSRLDEASDGILWISAPAGSGKSSLVASYLHARKLSPLWYNVDSRDADPASLFEEFTEALALAAPRKAATLPRFGVDSFPALPAFTRRFFERLYRALPPRSVLVLDDYHEAPENGLFHDLVQLAMAALAPGRRAIVISRSDPPPAFARRLVHGTLRVLDAEALLLTEDEARIVARARAGDAVSSAAIEAAHRDAEGWMAGFLLLLDPDLRGRAELPGGGALYDYFAAEMLACMPPEARRILLAAALLPAFNEETLARVTGDEADPAVVRRLTRQGLFLAAQSGASPRSSFRCHALFRSFLLERLRQLLPPDDARELERRAAEVCEVLGYCDRAVALHHRAGDTGAIARMVARAAPELVSRGQCQTLASWLSLLPRAAIEADGWLSYWEATAGMFGGAPPGLTRQRFEAAYRVFAARGDEAGRALSTAGCIQAIVYDGNDFTLLDELVERVTALDLARVLPTPELELQVTGSMVLALTFRGSVGIDSERWLVRASELAATAGSVSQRMMILGQLLFYRALRGEMAEASLIVARIERVATGGDPDPLAAQSVLLARALTAWLSADDDGCLSAVEEGLLLGERTGVQVLRDVLLVYGTFGALGKEDRARVSRYLDQLGHLADCGRRLDSGNFHSLLAWDALDRGDLPAARVAQRKSREAAERLGGFALALSCLLEALIAFEEGELAKSRARLDEAAVIERQLGNPGLLYWRELVEAHVASRAGQGAAADEHLRRAFARGRELGIYNALWPERRYLSELCLRAIEAGIEPDYARSLAQRRKLVATRPPEHIDVWPFRLEVRLFGKLSVHVDGAALRFTGKTPKVPLALLAALVLFGHDGRELSQEFLADQLWPDSEGDAGLHALETALYRLRKLLGDESLIRLQSGKLRLDPALCSSDYGTCVRLLTRLERTARERGDARQRDDFARLRAWYDAGLLVGWSQPWATAARERLQHRLESVLNRANGHGSAVRLDLLERSRTGR
jgi:hypothetical protein